MMIRNLLLAMFAFVLIFGPLATAQEKGAAPAAEKGSTDPLRYLPVQDGGRIKPFDTFARETLQLVYGSQTYKTPSGKKREAIEIIFLWMLLPQVWDAQKIIQINHKGLKDSLKLSDSEKYFTPTELFANPRLSLVMQELRSFAATKQKMTPYFASASQLESQLSAYQLVKQGPAVRVAPPTPDAAKNSTAQNAAGGPMEPEAWISITELQGELQAKFGAIIHAFVRVLPALDENSKPPMDAAPGPNLQQAVDDFKAAARERNPALYPSERDIALEIHNQTLHPFKITWALYLIGAIFLALAWHLHGKKLAPHLYVAGWTFAITAFLFHTYGFSLRIYLTGRPPVSNMYESVVWVSWGALLFAMIFEAIYRRRFILIGGSIVGVLCLIVADLAPTILDPSLKPLEPVLRSNMWLTVHVLTITLSYSAFFLAWGLGNIGCGFLLRGAAVTDERVRALVNSIYRSVQVGVVLLAAGTILGGVWADYSWGRFWGWDPKETWAFIALMGYLAILHARLVGWVQNIGMLVTSVVAFNLVIMAWYGVNFVLGAGLHTYGMGAGGVQYVAAFILVDVLYVGYALYVHSARLSRPAT